ncbi:MAG TPA: type II toxin-antitoxin system VapC family toxin [Thermoanaerobaculia bacterium]|nr:type II toxin-antitoxin system VapC family toxin [Thermoanaerobaculia bacterium]
MAWVVDTCILIDVFEDDPRFGRHSALTLDACADQGLVLCPVTYTEMAPAFRGDLGLQDEFLTGIGIDFRQEWSWADTLRAHRAWHDFIRKKRSRELPKRPLADILIGAFATRHDGLITRNPADFAAVFPDLALRDLFRE